MDGVYHLEDNKNIRRGPVARRRKFTGSALLISQSSGKDKPPSIDAAVAPNEHGRGLAAASVIKPEIQSWTLVCPKTILTDTYCGLRLLAHCWPSARPNSRRSSPDIL